MSQFNLDSLSDTAKGFLAIIVGTILLFYTLGLIETWINTIFIVLSLGLIAYGLYVTGLINLAKKLFSKYDKKN